MQNAPARTLRRFPPMKKKKLRLSLTRISQITANGKLIGDNSRNSRQASGIWFVSIGVHSWFVSPRKSD
jgi:hypothetical protein